MVDHALNNLTAFCEIENDFKEYQRARCPYYNEGGGGESCWGNYRSTKTGPVMHSTKHRPWIVQSTKHEGGSKRVVYQSGRRKNYESWRETELKTEEFRKKRDTEVQDEEEVQRFQGRRYNVRKKVHPRWDDSGVTAERHRLKRKREEEKIKSFGRDDRTREEKGKKQRTNKKGSDIQRKGVPRTVKLSKKNKEFYEERKWPHGVVPYIISKDENFDIADLRRRLEAVNRILKKRTCVMIEEITEDDAERFEDYLVLDASADYITGRVGGRQNFGSLELFEGGQHKQHTAMMVMAMLGFYFELARHDRDAHVRVHMRHVRADKLHHFEKIRSDATLPLPYDYESATHPAWQFWRKLGRTGISTVATYKDKDPDGSIMRSLGQQEQLLSDLDIVKINSVYGVKCFSEPKQDEENNEQDSEDEERDKYKDIHGDRDTKDKDLEKHKDSHDKYKITSTLEERDEEKHKIKKVRNDKKHKIKEDERNVGRYRDRHRNKHGIDIDDGYQDKHETERHRRPLHKSEEVKEEMHGLGNSGRGYKEDVHRQNLEKFKNSGESKPTNKRDWELGKKTDGTEGEDKDYSDNTEEIRPGVVTKHGGKDKGRNKNVKEKEIEEIRPGSHERENIDKNRYLQGREIRKEFVPNRFQIKDREESDRYRHKDKIDRDLHEIDKDNRESGRDKHRDRRDRDIKELERDTDRHFLSYTERRESGFNAERQIARDLKEYNGGHSISSEQKDYNGGRSISNELKGGYTGGRMDRDVKEGYNGGQMDREGDSGGHPIASEIKETEIKWSAGD